MRTVIIGAGPAGVNVVETIRNHDRTMEIVMLSSEPFPPYSPPAMVDHFLTGSGVHFWRDLDWSEQMGVTYRQKTTVSAVQPDAHLLELEDGSKLGYDRLVIATGSRLSAPLPGVEKPGVYNFKSLSAAETLIQQVRQGQARRAVIVGAGFIGMEIALLLRALGLEVIQVEMLDQVMANMLDVDTAEIALEILRHKGVEVRLQTRAEAFIGNGRVRAVRLATGEEIAGDVFVAATGIRPNLEFLARSGINTSSGILVDEHLRCNAADIYAAGDVAETTDRLTGERSIQAILPNAVEQGQVVGLNLVGYPAVYQGSKRMNSLKHLGLPIMAAGIKSGDEKLQTRQDGCLRTLYFQEGNLVGFQLVKDISAAGVLNSLLYRRLDISRIKDRLLEPGFGEGMLVGSIAG